MYGRAFRTIGIGLVIPLIGVIAAQLALGSITGGPSGAAEFFYGRPTIPQAEAACLRYATGDPLCDELWALGLMRQASLWSALALILVIGGFLALARFAGADRGRNASIFPPLVPFTTYAVALLILIHGAILTYAVYVGEIWLTGDYHLILPALVGFGALIGATSLIAALRAANIEQPAGVLARAVTQEEAPALWRHVDELAEKLGARKPANIVVGLDPTFFATAAPIAVPERAEPLQGETLYLSLPLMRLFSTNELNAVVGHELGHFRGGDTAFSLRFAPVYRTLTRAIHALDGDDGRPNWIAAIPGSMILNLMLEAFARNERRISRDREFEADRAGLEVSNADGLALSLAKVAVYAPLWGKTRQDNIARINEGKISPNLAKVFEESARFDVSHQLIGDVLAQVLTHRIPHPTDSHPPVADRYAAIGFDPKKGLTIEKLTTVGAASKPLFADLGALERALTIIEHQVMIESGAAQAPAEGPKSEPLLNAAYVLAATMVGADGQVDPEEIKTAEGVGARLFKGFDPVSFRQSFEHLAELPSFEQVVMMLDQPLSPEDKRRIHAFLLEIAAVDGEIAAAERALLDLAARRWRISRPIELRLPGRRAARNGEPTS